MIASITAGLLFVTLFRATGTFRVVVLNLPSTAAHELAHWVLAFLTGCRPGFPSLLPIKEKDGYWTLGSVAFTPRPFFAAWVALAPLFLAPAAYWALFVRQPSEAFTVELAWGMAAAFLTRGSLPSRPDWVIALKHPLGVASALSLLYGIGYLLRA